MPIILNVPFAEKDEAKGLGARWDATQRKWYVADGTRLSPFERWLPEFTPAQPVAATTATKNAGTAKARRNEELSDAPAKGRGDRMDSIEGKITIGALYVDLSHDCIPWQPCPQCDEALAKHRAAVVEAVDLTPDGPGSGHP